MKLTEVTTKKLAKQFIKLPDKIYFNDKNWIKPLDDDIAKVFDPKRNKYFKHGSLCRWILIDESGEVIGRIAAFINESKAYEFDQPTGCMGFFECINNQEAANVLFAQCKLWLEERGMEAMDGPVNFGERNMWWGLLVDGFEPPCYGMNYNPIYYKDLIEGYGFKLYFNQYSHGLNINAERPKKFYEKADLLMKDPNYTWEHIVKDKIESKYIEDFRYVYNKAFGGREGVKPITAELATNLIKALKPVLVEELAWFGYYKDEPIAIFFMMPELNQYFKYVNGKMNIPGKLKFVWHKWRKTNRKVFGFLFGVIPEFQGKGVDGGIIIAANKVLKSIKRWDDIEMTWVGDFNLKMMKMLENLGTHRLKTHVTFRKLFDETKPFHRKPMEIEDMDVKN